MPQNTFLGTGILDGQIVEANQISQSVDAFTGAKDYRITLTGSMELSGSFFMSGSFINEYTGQFSTLGLGVAAPTAPTMLYIKDTSAGGDPAVVIEATTGNDSAKIRLKNPDVEYDLGVFGASGDRFMIIQDASSGPSKYPFLIGKDTVSYTLYAVDDSVGVGLGSNTPVFLQPLDPGSLQAAGRVSGSSMRADIISASAAGENLHGTASYATYIETAVTASYVKASDIDFYYSISQQVNSGGRIAAVTGSYGYLQLDANSGLSIGNDPSSTSYTKIISGSGGGDLYLGSVGEGNFIKMTGNANTIELDSGDKVYLKDNVVTPGTITISGSLSGDRKLVVGPNNTAGTINARSSSLLVNSLEFNENSEASCVGNYNSSNGSKLILSAGGGPSNKALTISASRDIEFHGLAELNSTQIGTNELSHTGSLFKLNQSGTDCDRIMQQQTYRMAFKTMPAAPQGVGILWQIFFAGNATQLPRLNLTDHNGGVVMFEADITATSTSNNGVVASWKIITTRRVTSTGITVDVFNPAGNDQTVVHKAVTSGLQINDPNIDTSGATNHVKVLVNADPNDQLKYGGFIKLTYMGYSENIC